MSPALLALQLACAGAVSVHLRGGELSGPAPAAAAALSPAPAAGYRGERGHFYYADGCEDCLYKANQCGCKPSMEYFACLTKHCFSSNRTRFAEKCTKHSNDCAADLDIDCRGPDTVCAGKFNQLPTGGLGLSLDLDGAEDDAFCGPHGKCIGQMHMRVNIHNAPASIVVHPIAAAPSPAAPASPAPASPASPAGPAAAAPNPIWLECGLPKVSHADIDAKEDWNICQAEAQGDKAECEIPMFPTLKASDGKKSYCVLTAGKGGERLTEPAYHEIVNVHDKEDKAKAKAPETEGAFTPEKLPWMKDKEARQAKRAKEAKEAEKEAKGAEAKDETTANEEEKAAPVPAEHDAGRPPWMHGQPTPAPIIR